MYAGRFVTRTLPRCTPYLNHMLSCQKPVMRARLIPMLNTFRYLCAKPPPPPPPSAAGGGSGAGAAVVELPPTGIILKIIKARIAPELGYDDRNMRLGRILSPALSIYKKQLTSVLSILLRMSGFAMTLAVWALGLTGLFSKRSLAEWAEEVKKCECSPNIVSGVKFVMIFPFAYHVVAGTRHLIWHLDMFLTKPAIYATGYAAVLLTFVLAAGMTLLNTGEQTQKDVVDLTEADKKNKKAAAEKQATAEAKEKDEKKAQEKSKAKKQAQAKEAEGKAKEPPK
ncbi:uncharacterized protein LOC111065809 [Drosophila obscura]|uniref:uncharacterized protein LOC111065809 n=1 Tax=Drosophila obscura TaxID=7282 RepID=UPI001BB291F3|nr:uncharacterized protein LOC111065809 [Drosophila obscura]